MAQSRPGSTGAIRASTSRGRSSQCRANILPALAKEAMIAVKALPLYHAEAKERQQAEAIEGNVNRAKGATSPVPPLSEEPARPPKKTQSKSQNESSYQAGKAANLSRKTLRESSMTVKKAQNQPVWLERTRRA